MATKKSFKEKVIKVLLRDENTDSISELRIASWIVNGKETKPKLERRDKYISSEGEEKPGKAKGLSITDISFVLKNGPMILNFMGGNLSPQQKINQESPANGPKPQKDESLINHVDGEKRSKSIINRGSDF